MMQIAYETNKHSTHTPGILDWVEEKFFRSLVCVTDLWRCHKNS